MGVFQNIYVGKKDAAFGEKQWECSELSLTIVKQMRRLVFRKIPDWFLRVASKHRDANVKYSAECSILREIDQQ